MLGYCEQAVALAVVPVVLLAQRQVPLHPQFS